jgi:hypothetical protein
MLLIDTAALVVNVALKEFVDGIEAKDGKEATVRWAHIDMAVRTSFF